MTFALLLVLRLSNILTHCLDDFGLFLIGMSNLVGLLFVILNIDEILFNEGNPSRILNYTGRVFLEHFLSFFLIHLIAGKERLKLNG